MRRKLGRVQVTNLLLLEISRNESDTSVTDQVDVGVGALRISVEPSGRWTNTFQLDPSYCSVPIGRGPRTVAHSPVLFERIPYGFDPPLKMSAFDQSIPSIEYLTLMV